MRTCEITPGCENLCEGRTNGCASCNHAARKAERQAKKMQIVRPMPKVTEKRADQLQEYYAIKAEFLIANPCCAVEGCYLKSVDVHHAKGRQGDLLTNTKWFVPICRKHHDYFQEHSKEAIEKGISVSRTKTTEQWKQEKLFHHFCGYSSSLQSGTTYFIKFWSPLAPRS